jgi:hypothetical protein
MNAPSRKLAGKLFRGSVWFLVAVIVLVVGWINVATYRAPTKPAQTEQDVLRQLNNIGSRLRNGEGVRMQKLFPEGWFFSHVLYGFAWVNTGLVTTNDALRKRAITEARWVFERADSDEGKAPFKADTTVPNGVFYLGWMNRLLGGTLKLQKSEERSEADVRRFHEWSETLTRAYAANDHRNLAAYPGQTWPCDNVVALSSLKLHDELYGTQYQSVIKGWIQQTRQNLDPNTSLIPHKVNARNGEVEIAARGSSQVYILSFLPELDEAFGADQYRRFRSAFVNDWLGLMPVREYPKGKHGRGDVDSGPLIFGIGSSATVVSIAAARANGDSQLCDRNVGLSEIIGVPYRDKRETSFAFGKIVVADAFLAWGKSLVPWSGSATKDTTNARVWWQWKIHAVSSIGLLVIALLTKKLLDVGYSSPRLK